MATSLPWSVKGVDPRTRDAAKAAARRAGMTLGEWLDSRIRDQASLDDPAQAPANPPPPPEQLDIAALSERLAKLSQGQMETARTAPLPPPAPAPAPSPAPDLTRERIDAVITQAAMAERLTRDTSARTAGALDSIAKWIEKTESRLSLGERSLAERQERATSVLADAIKTMGERIGEIERRSQEARRAAPQQQPQPARPTLSRDGLAAAVSDIRSRQRMLDSDVEPAETAGPQERSSSVQSLHDLREELRQLGARLGPATAQPSPAARQEEQRASLRPLEQALGALGQRIEKLDGRDRLDPVLKPLARIEAEVSRLADDRSGESLNRFELEIAHLAAKVDALAARGGDQAVLAPILREISELRSQMAVRGESRQLEDLSHQLASLSSEVGRLRDAQPDLRELRGLAQAIDGVRDRLSVDRDWQPDNGPLLALSRQIEHLAQKVETLPAMKSSVIESQVGQIVARLGEMNASGRPASDELGERLEALIVRLESLSDRQPAQIEDRIDALQDRIETLYRQGPSVVEKRLDALADRLEGLAASSNLAQMVADESGVPMARVDLRPVEDMLRSLADKIDEAGRPGADSDSFDALERQIAGLATRLDEAAATRSAENGMERTLQDLVRHLQTMREDTAAAAEKAARAAVADIAPARGGSHLAELSELVTGLRDTHVSTGRETQDAIGAVHRTLEKIITRLTHLESELGSERGEAERPGMAAATSRQAPATAPATGLGVTPGDRFAAAARSASAAPALDLPLEPGSGRPRVDSPAQQPNDPQSIRQSLIAAARRSAKAASEAAAAPIVADAAKPAKAEKPAGRGRLKEIMEKRRRPLLLGLAALVLAIGAARVTSDALTGQKGGTEAARPAPEQVEDKTSSTKPIAQPQTAQANEPAGKEVAAKDAPAKEQASALPSLQIGAPAAIATPLVALTPSQAQTGTGEAVAALPPSAGPEPVEAVTGLGDIPATLGSAGLRKAALGGDARAVYELAAKAADAPAANRDPKLALRLFERAAVAGLAPAQFRLGNMFEKGIGTQRDVALARVWYGRAAERGNAKAMHNLAVLYAEGASGKPDYTMATEWFRRAAEHGVRDSQYNLAILLGRGLGAPADLGQSYRWFAIAAAQGDDDAARKRDEVAGRLSAPELAAAKQAVESWRPKALEATANDVAPPAKGWDEPAPAKPAKPARG